MLNFAIYALKRNKWLVGPTSPQRHVLRRPDADNPVGNVC